MIGGVRRSINKYINPISILFIVTKSIKYLFYLQDLRSKLAAHLSGKAYQKFLIKHQFNETETIEIIGWVLKGILVFIKKFNQSLKRKKAI